MRGGEFLGRRWDITLEAAVEGAMTGLRIVVVIAALGGLMSAAVDPDELLKALRRVSYRSALTAALATRLVPVLARDAGRMGDAARCRPRPPGRLAVVARGDGERTRPRGGRGRRARGARLRARRAAGPRAPRRGRATTCASAPRRSRSRWLAIAGRGRRASAQVEAYPTLEVALGPAEVGAGRRARRCSAAPRLPAARRAWGWRRA